MRRAGRGEHLFSRGRLDQVFANQHRQLVEEVESMDTGYILNANEPELCAHLTEKYDLEAPSIKGLPEIVSAVELDIDVGDDPGRYFSHPGPHTMKGQRVTVAVSVEGSVELANFRPSTSLINLPVGSIEDSEIHLSYEQVGHKADQLRGQIDQEVDVIRKQFEHIRPEVAAFMAGLPGFVAEVVANRKKKLLADAGVVGSLGFKMRKPADQPTTYAAQVRRRLVARKPEVSAGTPVIPEPVLQRDDYEHILGVMKHMSLMMERSPSTFAGMKEEAFRDHFLVTLNGHYEGDATGETFNHAGKTDILLRHEGSNIFVAECKFWSGGAGLLATFDQLLSYTTWRDTKTAIVLLNRERKMSTVLAQIEAVAAEHPCFARSEGSQSEGDFRFVFKHPKDPGREIYVAVLCFDVPRPQEL